LYGSPVFNDGHRIDIVRFVNAGGKRRELIVDLLYADKGRVGATE